MKTKNIKDSIENASSVMVPLSRRPKSMRHEYEIEYRGIKIRCPSLDAMKRAVRELEHYVPTDQEPWTSNDLVDFTGRIMPRQRKLLVFLLNAEEPATDEEIRRELQIPNNRALAGILSGVSKVALALDIDPRRVYKQATTYKNGLPERRYSVTEAFRRAVENHGFEESSEDIPEDTSGA